MLKWGILSTANIGVEQVISAILDVENSIISAIASRSEDLAKEVATRFAIPHTFGSYEEMLASDLVDAVYIPLPASHHTDWAIKAANAGKHVLCEKPISLHASEIDGIKAARDANNVLVSEAQAFRFAGINQYRLQVEAFARAAQSDDLKGGEEIFSLEDSRNNQKLIDAIYRAGESGGWETV